MSLLLLALILFLIFGGFGFAFHALWFVLIFVVVLAIVGVARR